ncbi:hypothetical protein [Kitasatospora sp. NPDC005748]|uniref:hypothetical protein n=1 Tax=unclassified Kitasatospora TaxID=2633591 RepID=UPI003409049D
MNTSSEQPAADEPEPGSEDPAGTAERRKDWSAVAVATARWLWRAYEIIDLLDRIRQMRT